MSLNDDSYANLFERAASDRAGKEYIPAIKGAVASHRNVPLAELDSSKRFRPYARARQIGMYLSRELTTATLPQIGRRFGGRDHTTVMHAVRKIKDLLEKDEDIRTSVHILNRNLKPYDLDNSNLIEYFARVIELYESDQHLTEKFGCAQFDIKDTAFVFYFLNKFGQFMPSEIAGMMGHSFVTANVVSRSIDNIHSKISEMQSAGDVDALLMIGRVENIFQDGWRDELPHEVLDRINALD